MIKIDRLGHVVLKVRDLERSTRFYSDLLGLQVMGGESFENGLSIRFLSANARDHHEIALIQVGPDAPDAAQAAVGLAHVAFRMPDQQALQDAYRHLKDSGVPIHFTVNHGICNGVYMADPDGNQIEVYADNDRAEWSTMDNPYAGTEGLPFATGEATLRDVMSTLT